MPNLTKQEKIELFKSVFKPRTDVFALRWENREKTKTGYFPQYKNWNKKDEYAILTDQILENHFRGLKTVGIYPLFPDNTSYFVVADFDGKEWLKSAKRLLKTSSKYDFPVYIERSRSGNGCHLWWFFEENYLACKSRKIFLNLIKESKNIDEFSKEDSFDRLFPNQDYHSGKGLGNLIALPLQGNSYQKGNSIFLDLKNNFEPYKDQWKFLKSIEKIETEKLDKLFNQFSNQKEEKIKPNSKDIPLTISSHISIPKKYINQSLSKFLTEELNFFNNEYGIKKRMGLSIYGIEKYFKTIEKQDSDILIPRGFLFQLLDFLKENSFGFQIVDERNKLKMVKYNPSFQLFDYQKRAVDSFKKEEQGILTAPSGSGKTIMGLELISQKKQPSLIIVHRKQIFNQWLERIEGFLGIPKAKIGKIDGNRKKEKLPITVAMVQTLSKMDNLEELSKNFGLVLIDECHHMPAQMFRQAITQLNPYYLFGLTATPIRKYNDDKLIFVYIGDIIHEIKNTKQKQDKKSNKELSIVIRETKLKIPFKVKTLNLQLVSRILTFDSERNSLISQDISKEAKKGKKCLILTERKDHIEVLNSYLKEKFETITLTGDLTPKKKKEREKQIQDGHFQVILATGQLLGEGTHFDNLDCLFLVYPFSFEGKLIQYIGRLLHSDKKAKTVYDYKDKNIDYLDRMFGRRERYYDKL